MAPLWRMFVNKFDPGFVFQSRKFSFVLTPISCSRFFSTGNNNNKNNVGTETSTSGSWHINRYWKQAKTTTELRAHFRAQLFNSQYKNLEVETRGENEDVALIRLNRPKAMNALNDDLITELNCALTEAEADEGVAAIVITGSERAFSVGDDIKEMYGKSMHVSISNFPAFDRSLTGCRKVLLAAVNGYAVVGADIEDMKEKTYQQVLETEFANLEGFKKSRKPVIAAVNGYALGGGCELAMLCDIIYAGEKAQFAQPEIILGTIPGVGGTQRLLRAIGKSKAMEMVLTGNRLSAHEAEKAGLVSKVFPPDQLVDETVKVAEGIAERSRLIAAMCKECLNKGYDLSLAQGTHFEKRNFHATFATHDKKEGMEAFVLKLKPVFKDC